MNTTREQIITKARKALTEINQIFTDCDHWNRIHPNEMPINIDPDGMLAGLKKRYEAMLQNEIRIVKKP